MRVNWGHPGAWVPCCWVAWSRSWWHTCVHPQWALTSSATCYLHCPPCPSQSHTPLLAAMIPPLQLRPGRKMASLSEHESEESRSRRRAGFRVVKGGAAGGGIDTNTVTDLTKLPPGFLEGGWRGVWGGLAWFADRAW